MVCKISKEDMRKLHLLFNEVMKVIKKIYYFFRHDKISIIFIVVSVFLVFLFFGILKWKIHPSGDILGAIIGIIASVIGIALPLGISNVSDKLIPYNSKIIANAFKGEIWYKLMILLIPLLAFCAVICLFFDIDSNEGISSAKIIELISTSISIFSLYVFYRFIRRTEEYVLNTDIVIIQKCEDYINKLSYIIVDGDKYIQAMEMCSCILQKKIKSDNLNDIDIVSKLLRKSMNKIYTNVKDEKTEGNIIYNISNKCYEIIYDAWIKCFRNHPNKARIFYNDYEIVIKYAFDYINNFRLIEPLFFFYQRISNETKDDEVRRIPYSLEVTWMWYFNIVFAEDFKMDFLDRANMYMFTIMKNIIDNGSRNVLNSFVKYCIDGMLYVHPTRYPHFTNQNQKKSLDKIKDEIYIIYTLEAYNKIIENAKKDKINTDEILNLLEKQYKYNQLQVLVAVIASYCCFKNHNDYVKDILFFNQPRISETHYINHDIVPDDLDTIVIWQANQHKLLFGYYMLWTNHNDIKPWFNKYIALMACRISEKKNCLKEEYYDTNKLTDTQKWYLIVTIDSIVNKIKELEDLNSFDLNDSLRNMAIKNLEKIKETVEKKNKKYSGNIELDPLKQNDFIHIIVENIKTNSDWDKTFSKCTLKGNTINEVLSFYFNPVMEKSFLAKDDDSDIYRSFAQSLAFNITNNIETNIETKMRAFSATSSGYENIQTESYQNEIFKLSEKDIVVLINYLKDFDFLFNDKGFKCGNDQTILGKTSNCTIIMNLIDSNNKTPRLFVFDKTEWAPMEINIDDNDVKIIDLNTDDVLRDTILQEKPYWLDKFDNDKDKESYLRKCVSIEISGTYTLKHVKQPKVCYTRI